MWKRLMHDRRGVEERLKRLVRFRETRLRLEGLRLSRRHAERAQSPTSWYLTGRVQNPLRQQEGRLRANRRSAGACRAADGLDQDGGTGIRDFRPTRPVAETAIVSGCPVAQAQGIRGPQEGSGPGGQGLRPASPSRRASRRNTASSRRRLLPALPSAQSFWWKGRRWPTGSPTGQGRGKLGGVEAGPDQGCGDGSRSAQSFGCRRDLERRDGPFQELRLLPRGRSNWLSSAAARSAMKKPCCFGMVWWPRTPWPILPNAKMCEPGCAPPRMTSSARFSRRTGSCGRARPHSSSCDTLPKGLPAPAARGAAWPDQAWPIPAMDFDQLDVQEAAAWQTRLGPFALAIRPGEAKEIPGRLEDG